MERIKHFGKSLAAACFALALCLILLPTSARAAIVDSGTCGANLTWTLDDAGIFTISGTGAMWDYYEVELPWYANRSIIKTVVVENGVTSIGSDAFSNCMSLTSVTIPNSVTNIGSGAFHNCVGLKDANGLIIINGILLDATAAEGVITIPEGVTRIGISAFYGWVYDGYGGATEEGANITSVMIPNSVTSIGNYAFYGCTGLTDIIIPDSVTSIGNNAFAFCRALTSITIPDSVTSIGNEAFRYCTGLTSATVSGGIKSVGESVFSGCSNLASVTIREGVRGIGRSAFSGCATLKELTIPKSVRTVSDNAFGDCTKLADIYYSGTEAEWDAIVISAENDPLYGATLHTHPAHVWGEWIIDTAATVDAEGAKHRLCTVCNAREDEVIPPLAEFKIYGASLTLYDSIAINYRVSAALFEENGGDYSDPYMIFVLGGVERRVDAHRTVGGYYVFDFTDIAPQMVRMTVSATLYATNNGTLYASETREYSVETYCNNMLAKYTGEEHAAFRRLLNAVLEYGDAAYAYVH